jgi:hypothetical protein
MAEGATAPAAAGGRFFRYPTDGQALRNAQAMAAAGQEAGSIGQRENGATGAGPASVATTTVPADAPIETGYLLDQRRFK